MTPVLQTTRAYTPKLSPPPEPDNAPCTWMLGRRAVPSIALAVIESPPFCEITSNIFSKSTLLW